MSEEDPEIAKERATVLAHTMKAAFPADHLAPWMSIHKEKRIFPVAVLKNIGAVGKELSRRQFKTKHPGKPVPKELDGAQIKVEEFEMSETRGPASMFAFGLTDLAQQIHDLAPSQDGIGRRQAIGVGAAQKTGVAVEPKKGGFWSFLPGRGGGEAKAQQKAGTG